MRYSFSPYAFSNLVVLNDITSTNINVRDDYGQNDYVSRHDFQLQAGDKDSSHQSGKALS